AHQPSRAWCRAGGTPSVFLEHTGPSSNGTEFFAPWDALRRTQPSGALFSRGFAASPLAKPDCSSRTEGWSMRTEAFPEWIQEGARVCLETLTKIPLQDHATDPGQLQKVEGAMNRRQLVIADFQPPGLADPRQGPFDHPADLAQPTAVRRPLPRQ